MSVCAASLMVSIALALFAAGDVQAASTDSDPAARAAEEHALRAQIDRMDDDLQALESKLYALEHGTSGSDSVRDEKRTALRDQIHRMDRDQELLEDRLHELEKLDPPAAQRQPPDPRRKPYLDAPAPVATLPEPTATPPPTLSPVQGATLRRAADPAIYEKAAGDRVSMFHYYAYRWIPVGTRQLTIYNSYDEAYLLDLDRDCPGLLTTERIKVENFSTKVVMGRDAVIADGMRCPIAGIRQLQVNRLPN